MAWPWPMRGRIRITRNESVGRMTRNIAVAFPALLQAVVALRLSTGSKPQRQSITFLSHRFSRRQGGCQNEPGSTGSLTARTPDCRNQQRDCRTTTLNRKVGQNYARHSKTTQRRIPIQAYRQGNRPRGAAGRRSSALVQAVVRSECRRHHAAYHDRQAGAKNSRGQERQKMKTLDLEGLTISALGPLLKKKQIRRWKSPKVISKESASSIPNSTSTSRWPRTAPLPPPGKPRRKFARGNIAGRSMAFPFRSRTTSRPKV